MKPRTVCIARYFGRISAWAVGGGLILIGLGEAINCALLCMASERDA